MCLKKYNVFECWKQRSITRCQQLLVFGWIKSVFLALNQTSAHQGCRVFCLFWVIIKWRERDNKITRPGSWHVNEEWDKLPLSPVWNVDVSSFGMREAGKYDRGCHNYWMNTWTGFVSRPVKAATIHSTCKGLQLSRIHNPDILWCLQKYVCLVIEWQITLHQKFVDSDSLVQFTYTTRGR